jgi:hypothetical protein
MLDTIAGIRTWFERAVPKPTNKNLHVQLGVHFEEVGEMLQSLQGKTYLTRKLIDNAMESVKLLAEHLKTQTEVVCVGAYTEAELLDALCDQVVTAVGVGHMLGYPMSEAIDRVNTSNWSKFVVGKPVFDENGKIRKGPDYHKVDLTSLVTPPATVSVTSATTLLGRVFP